MSADRPPPAPENRPLLRARIRLAAGILLLAAGCHRGSRVLKLHYIPQFVPGTRAIFAPTPIAVAPTLISVAPTAASRSLSEFAVGTVSDEHGDITTHLSVSDPAPLLSNALLASLTDAGLKPSLADRPDARRSSVLKPPTGFDFLLSCDLAGINVNQRFGRQRTVHGRVFTMRASLEMACTLHNRAGRAVFAATITGDDTEPPKRLGNEAFLPLETDPAESLSVALSRAIGGLILMLRDRAALPPSP